MTAARRRAVLLLAVALLCGGIAATRVGDKLRDAEQRSGVPVEVAVAARDVRAGAVLAPRDVGLRTVPARYVPPGVVAEPGQAVGAVATAAIERGGYLTAAGLAATAARGPAATLRRGERAMQVAVTASEALAELARGARVDVVVSVEAAGGAGRSFLALEDVEVLSVGAAAEAGPAQTQADRVEHTAGPSIAVTLRVTVRQAVYLAAVQDFARETRLLPRPARDRRRTGRAEAGPAQP